MGIFVGRIANNSGSEGQALLFDISKIKDLSLWNNEVKQAVSGMEWEEAQPCF
jgi:hypothetical protein